MTNAHERLRLMLVDDHWHVRDGLRASLGAEPDIAVVAEAGDGETAVELFRRHAPDVTLMDLGMPRMNGVEAIRAVRRHDPRARVVVLTMFDGVEDIYRAVEAGARGYLLKTAPREELLEAVRRVHAGLRYFPALVAEALAERAAAPELTATELKVLALLVEGRSNEEIARALDTTEGTVKSHVNKILSKLDASNRTQAAMTALRRGLLHYV